MKLDSFAERPVVDAAYFEALLIARRAVKMSSYELEAIETMDAAASALEHPQPTMDEGLARKLRQCVNAFLYLSRDHRELIRQVHELDGTYAAIEKEEVRGQEEESK